MHSIDIFKSFPNQIPPGTFQQTERNHVHHRSNIFPTTISIVLLRIEINHGRILRKAIQKKIQITLKAENKHFQKKISSN